MESLMDAIRYFELGFLHEVKNYAIKKDELDEYKKIAYLDILGGEALNCIAAFTHFLPQKKFLDLIDLDSDEELNSDVRQKITELTNLLTKFHKTIDEGLIEESEKLIEQVSSVYVELDTAYKGSL